MGGWVEGVRVGGWEFEVPFFECVRFFNLAV